MIFVTIGNGYGFIRLIRKMDEIAGKMDERVIMQIGCTKYKPKNAKYFRFLPKKEIEGLYKNARVVVCHDGVGSIITALQFGKPVIAVPRIKKYREIFYNNQGDFANKFAKERLIMVVYDVKNLKFLLENINSKNLMKMYKSEKKLVYKLKEYLDQLEPELKYL